MLLSTRFLLSPLLLMALHLTASHLGGSGPHIADVNILLPPKMTYPVEYMLRGSDGCFKWSWDHHDILSVSPEYNSSSGCSTSARLKSIAPYGGRRETAVYATDLNTGMVIRCKVYIDRIHRIQIFHSSVKLDLDGLATLRARAFDAEENVFSSLVGLQFMWVLTPETDGSNHHLVHLPLKDSPLSDCGGLCGDLDVQVKLEENGVFSDLCVVKGTEIGHENVSVHLLETPYEYLEEKIVLTVAEAMSLYPHSPVYVLVGAVIPYTLKVIRSNSPHVVSLPSPYHNWSVLDPSVAQVDQELGIVNALKLGVTTIVVEDTRVKEHHEISSLHVVLPDSLLLFMTPLSLSGDPVEGVNPISSLSQWYIVSGRKYLIHVKAFSSGPGAHGIYMTDNDEIVVHKDQHILWDILPVSNGINAGKNYRILRANSHGSGKLRAALAYGTERDTRNEVLKIVQEVNVCRQVQFDMESDFTVARRFLLPWVPGVYQDLQLSATGGCAMSSNEYNWFSSDMAVVSVSVSGIVHARSPGNATIRAVSIYDSLNYDEIVIDVSIPSLMVMLPYFPVETQVGSDVEAAVTLKTSSGDYFHVCDVFRSSVKWETDSESFAIVNGTDEVDDMAPSSHGPQCAWTRIYASDSGRTLLHATLSRGSQQYENIGTGSLVLRASSHIASYLPLIVNQASDGNQFGGYSFDLLHTKSQNQLSNLDSVYLAVGTSLDVMLQGGPVKWGADVGFFEAPEVYNENSSYADDEVSLSQLSDSRGIYYRIGCENLGTFKVVFTRGNLIGQDHHVPAVAEVELLLICSFPSSIVLIADEALNTPVVLHSAVHADRKPGRIHAFPNVVANGRKVRISAVGISHSGKAFANSSSLSLRWELTECEGLALWDDAYSSLIAKSSWEMLLSLQNASGLCIVRATVAGVDSLHRLDSNSLESSTNSLTDAIQLQLVSSLSINPEHSLLYFSPDARLNISIVGGSCFLDTLVNDTEIVEVVQESPAYHCSQLIVAPKRLGTALVTVLDIGLVPPLSASSTVQVADVDWITILSGEHISIVEGSLQSIVFEVGVGGQSFHSSQYSYMNIRAHIEDSVVLVVEDYDSPLLGDIHAPNFSIQATGLGVTTMFLSVINHSGHEVLSKPIKVEVYSPPRIHPSDLFLVPGASYVLTLRGGPKLGSRVQYSSVDVQSAEVHKLSGRLSAIFPGNSTIVATIYGYGNTILCEAYGKVKVGIPSSAVLNVQSKQLAVGRWLPIHPSLSEGNLFSFHELCHSFKWKVEDKGVLNFQETKSSQFIDSLAQRDYDIIQVLHGISAGQTTVAVSFSCDFRSSESSSKSMIYSASLSLEVVSDLPLALGSAITWMLPPYYTSSDLLPSSSHAHTSGATTSNRRMIAYSLLGQCQRKTEELVHIDGAKILTKDAGSLACIQAKDLSTGRADVASCIKVADMAQLRIMSDDFPVHVLAVGDGLELPIKYHDTLGNPFHEAHNISIFEVETNYPDVVSIENDGLGNVHIRAKGQGTAVVQISFISDPQISVFAIVSIGPQLYPQNPVLYQGTYLNLIVKGLNDSSSGQWFSSDESIVHVGTHSGKVEAVGEGTTSIWFESSNFQLRTAITVLKGNAISVLAPREILTNVPFPTKGYTFSLNFNNGGKHWDDLLFECEVDPPNIGLVKPWKDLNTGDSSCLFFPYSPEHFAHSGDTQQQTSLSVKASLRGDSGSASALFIEGFHILEMEKSLNLNGNFTKSFITTIGNPDIKINWNYKDRLFIRTIHGKHPKTGKHVKYEVSVRGDERFEDQLVFSLPATGQRITINVIYEPEERVRAVNMTLWAGVFGLLFLSILTVAFVIFYLDRPGRAQPRVVSGTSGVAAPVTPERSNPSTAKDYSPQTPQPFIDYVRNTIHETPYYRQDFGRRINPQNTY